MKKFRLSMVTAIMLVGVVSITAEEVRHNGMLLDDSMIEEQTEQIAQVVDEKLQGNVEADGMAISTSDTGAIIQPTGTETSGKTYYGTNAGAVNTAYNVAFFGTNAGNSNTTGRNNTFIGQAAGYKNTTGIDNTFSGNGSGNQNTTASENTFYGVQSGKSNTTGTPNTYIGTYSGKSNVTGTNNTLVGYKSGQVLTDSYNTYLGGNSGYSATTAYANVFVGYSSGYKTTTGDFNVFLGTHSGSANTTGKDNVYLGQQAGYQNQTGSYNVFIGHQAGYSETGSNKLYIDSSGGSVPLIYGEFDNNLVRVNGTFETKFNSASTTDVTELIALSVDNTNTSAMSDTGFKLTNAQEGVDWTFRTLEDDALIPSNHNAFAISNKGSGAKELIITRNNDTGGMKMILANGASCVAGNWVNASSRALKENIKELSATDAMNAFHALKPVTYNYKVDKTEKVVGFIAEDVPSLVAVNARNGLSPMDMVALLTKVVQEQDKVMNETKAELKIAQEKIAKLETMQKRLAKVESLLTNLALETSNSRKEKISLNIK